MEAGIAQPGEAIREYRFRFNRARRRVARDRTLELITEVEDHLQSLTSRVDSDREPIRDPEWSELRGALSEIERLAGSSTTRKGRWGELHRHLAWSQGVDLHDIAHDVTARPGGAESSGRRVTLSRAPAGMERAR